MMTVMTKDWKKNKPTYLDLNKRPTELVSKTENIEERERDQNERRKIHRLNERENEEDKERMEMTQ
jgi:hypothetical protein